MNVSEFDEAYEDDTSGRDREEQMLGEAILGAPIRALDPQPAVCVPESTPIREAIQLMLGRQIGAVLVERDGRAAWSASSPSATSCAGWPLRRSTRDVR